MRNNGSVTGREIELRDGQVIISRSDRHGRIVDVNPEFVEVSGYSKEELIGQQHNIIRHPDMPSEVFADMWTDLLAECPWIGVVQNRAKNGDAYWVEAHIAPIWEHGEVCGYMSMRWKPTDAQIALAKESHAVIRAKSRPDLVFRHGTLASASPWARLRGTFAQAPIQVKLILSSLLAALVILGSFAWLLADNLSQTLGNEARQRVRHNVGLVRAAVTSTVDSARRDAIDHAGLLSHRIIQALGGPQKATPAAIEALARHPKNEKENPIEVFLTDLRGAATIFVRTPDGLKRVMTTARDEHGGSAVGTLLAAENPALPELLAGRAYLGPARVFGHEYITQYTPIFDAKGRVIGATVIGIDLGEQLVALKTQLRATKIGEAGYYYIVNAAPGPEFGRLILHPYKEDQKIDTLVDRHGNSLVALMGARASGEITYWWKNVEAGEADEREKLVIFETMTTPHWVIAGGSTLDEFTALSRRVVWMVLAGGLAMAFVIFIVILVLVRNFIIQPLRTQVLPTVHRMSAGSFENHLDVAANDEVGKLVQGLECMQTRLAFESERERTLAMMRETARQEAEALSQSRAEFLANMSHEIRTPLNAVIGLAYLLHQSKLTPRDQEYVRRIEGAGKVLLAVVNDVLDFSKIDAGQMQIEDAPFRLDDVLDNLSNLVRNRVQEKGLILEYVVSPDVPPVLRGDALRLSQVLINLVSNAIKFTAEGSITIFVDAKPPEEGRVELEFGVQDTGIGMTSEQQANLFQAFSQGDSSVTRKFGGTGLGLVICKRLIELMGGDIWVESRPQAGSTFAFQIVLGVEDNAPPPLVLSGYRVLVVDDNDLARSVLQRLLTKNGCIAQTVDSGAAALAALHESVSTPFDCVMVDLNMPDMDGLALAHHIRSGPSRTTKLVMVTAENIHTSRFRHALGDFDDILEKPVTAARISEVLAQLHRGVATAPTQDTEPAPLAGLRLLVAEDVPTNQLIMRDLLESLGATVDVADNGALALEILAARGDNIDLVLMDIQMPEMDGLQATRRIRGGQLRADIPIIALTAHAFEEERQRALAAGMNDFLTKPIEPPQLIAVIQRWRPTPATAQESAVTPVPAVAESSIPVIAGVDVGDGLRRMLNRVALYEKVLRDFHTRFGGEADRIREALAAGDTDTAARRAHSLKGTGGMVGAKELKEQAALLEKAIKDGSPDTKDRLAQFERELQRVLDGIKAAFALN